MPVLLSLRLKLLFRGRRRGFGLLDGCRRKRLQYPFLSLRRVRELCGRFVQIIDQGGKVLVARILIRFSQNEMVSHGQSK